jgi:hypothetical protein
MTVGCTLRSILQLEIARLTRVRDLLFTKQSIYSYGRFSLFDHSEIIATGGRGLCPRKKIKISEIQIVVISHKDTKNVAVYVGIRSLPKYESMRL